MTVWKQYKLGEVCEIKAGGTPSRAKPEYWQNGDIPWVKIGDMKGKYVTSTDEKITKEGLENSSAKLLPVGTVLFSIFASLGEVALLGCEAATNQAIAGIIPNEEVIDRGYLYYYLRGQKQRIITAGRGVAQNNINLSILRNWPIVLPSIETQRRIADVIDKAQALIDKRKQQIELLDEFLQSVFLDMFGDPGANSEGWVVDKLGRHTSLVSSGSTPRGGSKVYTSQGIPLIRSQNVLMNQLSYEDVAFISKEIHEQMRRSQVRANDVLLNITGASIGRVALYKGEDCMANVNQHVCIIRLKESLVPEYVAYFISTPYMQARIQRQNAGATRQALNYSQIKDFDIAIPPLEHQKRFAQINGMVEEKKDLLMLSLSELKKIFNSIMQKAFRGELFG